jgi:hypothetical protein
MKYEVGDIVKWNDGACDPREMIMIITKVLTGDSFRPSSKQQYHQYYYRYRYLETQREDSYKGTLYESDTTQIA